METIEQLRELRASMPNRKKDPWGTCCKSKRILMYRALKRNSVSELTAGELKIVQEWLAYVQTSRKRDERKSEQIKYAINKITQ